MGHGISIARKNGTIPLKMQQNYWFFFSVMHKGIKPNAHDGCTQEVYSDSTKAPKHGYIEKKRKKKKKGNRFWWMATLQILWTIQGFELQQIALSLSFWLGYVSYQLPLLTTVQGFSIRMEN